MNSPLPLTVGKQLQDGSVVFLWHARAKSALQVNAFGLRQCKYHLERVGNVYADLEMGELAFKAAKDVNCSN